jgi:hypothetical protein
MSNLDKLIEKLKAAKEELAKNVNMSYSEGQNMAQSEHCPSPEQEDKKMRAVAEKSEKDNGNGKVVEGAKPSPEQEDKDMRAVAEKGEDCAMVKSGDDYFSLFKNGQWSLDKDKKAK